MERKLSQSELSREKPKIPALKGVQFSGLDLSNSSKTIESPHIGKPRRGSDIVQITSTKISKQSIEELIRNGISESVKNLIEKKLNESLNKTKKRPLYNLDDRDLIVNSFISKMEAHLKKQLITQKQFDLILTDKKESLFKLLGGAFGLGIQKNLDSFFNEYDNKKSKSKHVYIQDCLKSNEATEVINHLIVALLSPSKDIQDLIIVLSNDSLREAVKHGDFERATVTKFKEKCNDKLVENEVLFNKINGWIFTNFRLIYLVEWTKQSYDLEKISDLIAASYDGKSFESISLNHVLFYELLSVNKQIAEYFKGKIEQKMIYWESPRTLESPRSGSSSSSQTDSPRIIESPRGKAAPEAQEYTRVLKVVYSKLNAIINPNEIYARSKLSRSFSQGTTLSQHSSSTSLLTSQSAPYIQTRTPLELTTAIRIRDLSLKETDSTRSIVFGSPK